MYALRVDAAVDHRLARGPPAAAMSVNRAWNGRPEGLPRGCGLTPREETPCRTPAAEHASSASIARRVIIAPDSDHAEPGSVARRSDLSGLARSRIVWTMPDGQRISTSFGRGVRRRGRRGVACRSPRDSRRRGDGEVLRQRRTRTRPSRGTRSRRDSTFVPTRSIASQFRRCRRRCAARCASLADVG